MQPPPFDSSTWMLIGEATLARMASRVESTRHSSTQQFDHAKSDTCTTTTGMHGEKTESESEFHSLVRRDIEGAELSNGTIENAF